jgi:hypothetical protein
MEIWRRLESPGISYRQVKVSYEHGINLLVPKHREEKIY